MQQSDVINKSPLGQNSDYVSTYCKELLFPIPRKKHDLFSSGELSVYGVDIWNAYEVSWLDQGSIPKMAMVEFRIPFDSPNIIESKSLKLYLNSFNQTSIESTQKLQALLEEDLSQAAGKPVQAKILLLNTDALPIVSTQGACLDECIIEMPVYQPDATLLQADIQKHNQKNNQAHQRQHCQEALYSDLLKSNCPVTGQPDWATLVIDYHGPKINRASLLAYIISYRQHDDFHEQCVEQMFVDIWQQCQPNKLLVYARYVRRGGLDINPYRASYPIAPDNHRTERQ